MSRRAVVCASVLAAAACSRGGTMTARWTGAETGGADLEARAAWCGKAGPLLVFAVSGDTGIGLALYARDSLTEGRYPVVDPLKMAGPPAASFAARWPLKAAMADFRGDSGSVVIDHPGATVSGRVTGLAAAASGPGRLRVEATFVRVPVTRGGPDCATAPG